MGKSMANESADPATATATRRTALAIVGVMAASGITAGWFAWSTVNNRRMRDLKPGPVDPMLGHITAETRFACGPSANCPSALLARFQPVWINAEKNPTAGPWCMLMDAGGGTALRLDQAAPLSANPPFLARLVAGKRPERALFWLVSAGGQPESSGRLAASGFPRAGDPAWVAEITRHPWLVWVEEQAGLWAGRMVVRPGRVIEAKALDAFVEAGAPDNLRHQRDGGDVLLGWGLPKER